MTHNTSWIEGYIPEGAQQTWIDRWIHHFIGKPKSLDDLIGKTMREEAVLIEATRASIRRQEFDLHMSLSRIQALEDWNHGKVKKELSV